MKGIFWGALLGASAGLLVAPIPGGESRRLIRDQGMVLKEKAATRVDETRSKAEELARLSVDRVTEAKDRSQETLDEGSGSLRSIVAGVKEGLRTYKELNQ